MKNTLANPIRLNLKKQLVGVGLVVLAFGAQAEVAVIANSAFSGTADDEAVAKVFLGQSKTLGGVDVGPVDLKEGPTRDDFGSKVLKKTTSQVKALWARQVFTGGAKPPKEIDSEDGIVKYVASTPGAVGYVDAGKVGGGVKVIFKR